MTEQMQHWLREARRLIFNGDSQGAAVLYLKVANECTKRAVTCMGVDDFMTKQGKRHMAERSEPDEVV